MDQLQTRRAIRGGSPGPRAAGKGPPRGAWKPLRRRAEVKLAELVYDTALAKMGLFGDTLGTGARPSHRR